MPILIAFVGLPRSGKSTIANRIAAKIGAPIVRRDAIRLALHGQRYLSIAEPMVKGISAVMLRALFEAGHFVVVCDETNYSRAARDAVRDDEKWTTFFVEVRTPKETCIERAHLTGQPDLEPVINQMWDRMEPLDDDEERGLNESNIDDLVETIVAQQTAKL